MGKLRQTALILGEGPTEFFYFKSLCDVFKRLTIKPDYPKHTNIKELEAKIAEGVEMGYSHIFCIIDMDTKDKEPEHSQYHKLKVKYAKPIDKSKKGIYCDALVESGKVGGRGVESPVGHVGRDGHVQCKSHSHRADGCVGLVEHGVHELKASRPSSFNPSDY